jgi:hypothetical protein
MEPWRLVTQYGVAAALSEDRRHWADGFLPTISQAIVDFAAEVARGRGYAESAVA